MIHSTSNIFGYTRTDAMGIPSNKNVPAPKLESVEGDRVSNSNTQALRNALITTPEIRPEIVERGRLLAADSNYPPLKIIRDIAKLLVDSRDPSEHV